MPPSETDLREHAGRPGVEDAPRIPPAEHTTVQRLARLTRALASDDRYVRILAGWALKQADDLLTTYAQAQEAQRAGA